MQNKVPKSYETIKEPWLSILLSSLIPGAGQFHGGYIKTAILWFTTFILTLIGGSYEMLSRIGDPKWAWNILTISTGIYLLNIIHIFVSVNGKELLKNSIGGAFKADPFCAIFLNQWVPGLGQVYMRQWIDGSLFLLIFITGMLYYHWGIFSIGRYVLSIVSILYVVWHYWKNLKNLRFSGTLCVIIYTIIAISILYINNLIWVAKHENSWNEPTIQSNDYTLQLDPSLASIERGNFIAYTEPNLPGEPPLTFCGRAVAFEKDTVLITGGDLYINGRRLLFGDIKYVGGYRIKFAINNAYIVGKDSILVLGDNSVKSLDSRQFGAIDKKTVRGIALKIISPYDRAISFVPCF